MKKALITITILILLAAAGCSRREEPVPTGQENPPAPSIEEVLPEPTTLPDSATEPDLNSYEDAIDLPILDEIDQNTRVATAGAYSTAVKSAENLLDWGCYTGLGMDEIYAGAQKWKLAQEEAALAEFVEKLRTVDDVYLLLVGVNGDKSDQKEGGAWAWGRERVEAIEVIMQVFGLREVE